MEEWLHSLAPWGTDVIVWAQSISAPWLDFVFGVLTALGYEEFYLLVLPLVYWCLHKEVGAGLGYLALLSSWVNSAIKHLFLIPRPSDPAIEMRAPRPETSPSFPSGHAQNAVANWGYLAYRVRKPGFTLLAAILILGIGISRVFLGVHYPQDVIAGWLIGLVLLLVFIWAEPLVRRRVGGLPTWAQVALAAGMPLLLIFLHPADVDGLYPAEAAVTPMSALAGLGIGLVMERALVRFQVDGVWWRRVLRYLVGIAVVAVLYAGPSALVPDGLSHGLESAIRFLRYSLLGWAVAFVCPWLFVRMRLAKTCG